MGISNGLISIDELIKEYVKRYETDYSDSHTYNRYTKEMKGIDLMRIDKNKVNEVVKPFLHRWGRMGRVMGRMHGWEGRAVTEIQKNHKILGEFREKDVVDVNLGPLEQEIKILYESFRGISGNIASAKILHLICSDFFPLWDNDIANNVRYEIKGKCRYNKRIEDFSGEDYYRFMIGMQNFIKEHKKTVSDLSKQYGKGRLKIVDECLFWAVHRPLFLVMG